VVSGIYKDHTLNKETCVKKLAIILMILLAVAGLVMAEDGRRESGLGLSYGQFIFDDMDWGYGGYGLEFYSNYKAGFLFGFGSSSNYYYFTEDTEGYNLSTDLLAIGLTALIGPSIEINLGALGFQVLGGVGFDCFYIEDTYWGTSASYIGLLYGADARILLGFTRNFRLYGSAGFTAGVKPLMTDRSNTESVLNTGHATLGLQIAR